ncbi:hypothetical protein FF1_033365 [Malus domestica]
MFNLVCWNRKNDRLLKYICSWGICHGPRSEPDDEATFEIVVESRVSTSDFRAPAPNTLHQKVRSRFFHGDKLMIMMKQPPLLLDMIF